MSYLKAIDAVDGFSYECENQGLYTFFSHDKSAKLGFVIPLVVENLLKVDGLEKCLDIDNDKRTITINKDLDTIQKRNDEFARLASALRELDTLYTLKGWRDELYTIFYPSHEPYLQLERAVCPLFGVVMYGVHIVGYIPPHISEKKEIEFWIAKRSLTKATWPGFLDNTIAGGLGYPHGVHDTVIKESQEEAGLAEEYVKANIKPAGAISYMFQASTDVHLESALIQPEVQYLFDLTFDTKTIPAPFDNEAESFELMTLAQVQKHINEGRFKPNCAAVLIDFLIRHGYITAENEPNYIEIQQRMHRRLPFPTR